MDTLYPGLGNKTWLTKGGNVLLKNKEGKYSFHNPELNFIREVSNSEGEHISNKLTEISIQCELDSQFAKFCLGKVKFPTWIFVKSIQVTQDNSNYRWETCNNGGNYSFQVYHHWYVAQYPDGNWKFCYVETHYTSAEFEYDELKGCFQQDLGYICVTNANGNTQYKTQGGKSWDGEFVNYSVNEVLEKIATISTFEQMWNEQFCYYPSKFEDDNYESECNPALTISDKKEIIRLLKNLDVNLRQGCRRHKKIGFRKSNRR